MKTAKRFQKQDWLQLAHKQIVREGSAGLTIERLCGVGKRTRGSFYHHFKSHEEFITQMMLLWAEKHTDDLIDETKNISDPSERLESLGALATSLDYRLEVAIRLFAQGHLSAGKILKKVDDMRVAYLKQIYFETTRCDQQMAEQIAKIEYAAFVGAMILWPKTAVQDSRQLDPLFRDMVMGYLGAKAKKRRKA